MTGEDLTADVAGVLNPTASRSEEIALSQNVVKIINAARAEAF